MKATFVKFKLLAIVVFIFAAQSCTEAYKKKQAVADGLLGDLGATSVFVGYSTKANLGEETRNITTLTFSGVNFTDAIEGEMLVNEVAYKFYSALSKEDLKGETHLEIVIKDKDAKETSVIFENKELALVGEYQAIADAMVDACVKMDIEKMKELKSDDYMPEDQMTPMYELVVYNDSIYQGQKVEQKAVGFRFATGAQDETLKMFSANYECGTANLLTKYTVNVDQKTKKVVYLWMKTDPR